MKKLMILAALLPLLTACVYDFEASLTPDQYTVVVEGDIIVGGTTTIRFSRLNPEVLEKPEARDWSDYLSSYADPSEVSSSRYDGWGIPVSFTARVEGEDGSVVEADGVSGFCTLDTRSLSPGTRYRLCLYDKEKKFHYASQWETVQGAPEIDRLSYRVNEKSLDVMISFHSDGSTPYYCLAYDEQWEYRAYATTTMRYLRKGEAVPAGWMQVFPEEELGLGDEYGRIFETREFYPNYTCWNTSKAGVSTVITTGAMVHNKMVDYVFRTIDREDRRISVAYRPIVSLRMISQESYAYWESLERASSQTGDLFSPIPSTVRGNIVNEDQPEAVVIGYIGASRQVSAEMMIRDRDIHLYREPALVGQTLLSQSVGWGGAKGVKMYEMPSQYLAGNRPWRVDTPENGNGAFYVWLPERCMDCRNQGGSIVKPQNWPEE